MANHVSDVVLSIHVKLPESLAIRVENVLTAGSGTLSEALQGGQVSIGLTLTHGKTHRALQRNEQVFVHGLLNGQPFMLDNPLQVTQAHEPWQLAGKTGSPG